MRLYGQAPMPLVDPPPVSRIAAPFSRRARVHARALALGRAWRMQPKAARRAWAAPQGRAAGGRGRAQWRASGRYVLSNLHLCPGARSLFSILEQLGRNLFIDVCLTAIGADLSRHAFHHHCQATALKSNCGCARLRRCFFADNAFHEILFLQSRSHSEGSGS